VLSQRRGPPATGKGELIGVRLQPPSLSALDGWIAAQPGPQLSRPEAIRRLVEQALSIGSAARPYSKKTAAAAAAIAEQHIDPLVDPSAPSKERQRRKQRLLKGPKEFRDIRGKRKNALQEISSRET
jgi:hypothetical protein